MPPSRWPRRFVSSVMRLRWDTPAACLLLPDRHLRGQCAVSHRRAEGPHPGVGGGWHRPCQRGSGGPSGPHRRPGSGPTGADGQGHRGACCIPVAPADEPFSIERGTGAGRTARLHLRNGNCGSWEVWQGCGGAAQRACEGPHPVCRMITSRSHPSRSPGVPMRRGSAFGGRAGKWRTSWVTSQSAPASSASARIRASGG